MAKVRLTPALPDDERNNGLTAIAEQAVLAPHAAIMITAELHVDKIVRDVRSGDSVPIFRIARIEVGEGDLADALRNVAAEALEDRLGIVALPFTNEEAST
jgi:hypothetical protein